MTRQMEQRGCRCVDRRHGCRYGRLQRLGLGSDAQPRHRHRQRGRRFWRQPIPASSGSLDRRWRQHHRSMRIRWKAARATTRSTAGQDRISSAEQVTTRLSALDPGSDIIDGGVGTDTADYSASTTGVIVSCRRRQPERATAPRPATMLSNIERRFRPFADTLMAPPATPIASGRRRQRHHREGGAGADAIDGGAGTDTASYARNTTAGVIASLATNSGTGGDANGDTFTGIEALTEFGL